MPETDSAPDHLLDLVQRIDTAITSLQFQGDCAHADLIARRPAVVSSHLIIALDHLRLAKRQTIDAVAPDRRSSINP